MPRPAGFVTDIFDALMAADARNPETVAAVKAKFGVDGLTASERALDVDRRIRALQNQALARDLVAAEAAVKDQRLSTVGVAFANEFLSESCEPAGPLLGPVVSEGYNATWTGQKKIGKTKIAFEAAAALVSGTPWLGQYATTVHRVCFMNYELTAEDARAQIRALDLEPEAQQRLLVMNLRGARLSLTTPAGSKWLVGQLSDNGIDVLIVDTYGAASAQSVENENDNASARRFLGQVDEIKAEANCPSLLMTAHTGRKVHEEGAEHARGATVLDDWVDVRMILTRDRSGTRYLSSEGRSAYDLPESALVFDPVTLRLRLADHEIGVSRAAQREAVAADAVAEIVSATPGLTTSELRLALGDHQITNNDAKSAAVSRAVFLGVVHNVKEGRARRYYPGPALAAGAIAA